MAKPKKKKHIPIHIWDELFKVNFHVSYGIPSKDFIDSSLRSGFEVSGEFKEHVDGKTIMCSNDHGLIILIWTKKKDIPILAHEVFHAVYMALDCRGVSLSDDSDEVYAYHISMMMEKILGGGKKVK